MSARGFVIVRSTNKKSSNLPLISWAQLIVKIVLLIMFGMRSCAFEVFRFRPSRGNFAALQVVKYRDVKTFLQKTQEANVNGL